MLFYDYQEYGDYIEMSFRLFQLCIVKKNSLRYEIIFDRFQNLLETKKKYPNRCYCFKFYLNFTHFYPEFCYLQIDPPQSP